MYGDLFCHFSGNQPVLWCILCWPRQAEELVLILMDKSSSASEYSQTWCVSVCTYPENTVYQNPSFLFLGLVFFASENIQASCLVCLFQSVTHMWTHTWAEPLQKLQVCVYSSRMNQFGMLSFLLVLLMSLQRSQHIANVYRRQVNSQQIK